VDLSNSDYWETVYKNGEFKHWEFAYPSPELIALVSANFLPQGAHVLEVGSGGGMDSIFLAQSCFQVLAIDISLAALKIANKRAKKSYAAVNWIRGNIFDLPIHNETIDFVSDRGLFHLLEDNERPMYASEIFRVLKENGRALIRGKSSESSHGQFNPITEEAINNFFPSARFSRGPVLRIPLFSVEGSMDAMIVMLQKRGRK
jgi:ubiquinone/menaquinone biosynthesis C-methylase UbiE